MEMFILKQIGVAALCLGAFFVVCCVLKEREGPAAGLTNASNAKPLAPPECNLPGVVADFA